MEYVEARLILISVHATPAGPPSRNLRASRSTLEREVAASGVGGGEGGGRGRWRVEGENKRANERKEGGRQ